MKYQIIKFTLLLSPDMASQTVLTNLMSPEEMGLRNTASY